MSQAKKKDDKPFTVSITDRGSKKALPAIWYGGRAGQWFNVIKSKQWPSVYEVINGKHIGMLIDPKDCEKITILLNSEQNPERSVATKINQGTKRWKNKIYNQNSKQ